MSPSTSTHEYIVIGAGSSGCVVAGQLAADRDTRVLLVESGAPAEANPETLQAAGYKTAFINDALLYDRYSAPQAGCGDRPLFVGTGRGVGGSGAVNAMVYTRGARHDFEAWGAGWGWSDLLPAFTALEARLRVTRRPPTPWTEACIAAADSVGIRRKEDLNDGALAGHLGYEWMNMAEGERRNSYVAFVKPLRDRANLTLQTQATVERIVIERTPAGPRATGVLYRYGGQRHLAQATREVIVCAGALESPKLLMLSGIGPGAALRAHGIEVVLDQPRVGQNLMDHPNVQLFFRGRASTECDWAQLYGFVRANPHSQLPAGEADSCFVFYSAKSSFREGVIRLLPGIALPQPLYRVPALRGAMRTALKGVFALPPVQHFVERMYGIVVILGKPESRGVVSLASAEATRPARVDPRYFSAPADLATLLAGVKLARRVAAAPALADWGNRELLPGPWVRSDERLARFIQNNAMTTYHFAGTCKMGAGDDSVVDAELRVRGVAGLRVADASIIPSVPVAAMNAPSMIIGWRAAELLRAARERPSALSSCARAVETL